MNKMKAKVNLKITFGILILALLLLAPAFKVLADTPDSQNTGSDHTGTQSSDSAQNTEHETERNVQSQVNTQNGEAQIQSEMQYGSIHNSFEFQLETHDQLQFSYNYKSSVNSTQTKVQMKFELRSLVEFIDNTSNPTNVLGALDAHDQIVQQINFHQIAWNMTYSKTTVSNQTIYNIVVNGSQGSMVITFTFLITTGIVNQGNYTLTPNAIKFNVEIQNFPFKDPNSLLATQVLIKNRVQNTQVETNTENHQKGYSGQEHQLAFNNNTVGAFFSWSTTYLADGVNKTVIVSPVTTTNNGEGEDGSYGSVYFNFAHAQDIFWDPSVGVTLASMTGAISTSPGFEFIGILVLPLIALGTIIKKRKQNKK